MNDLGTSGFCAALIVFSASHAQALAGMPERRFVVPVYAVIHARFRFARAGRMSGFHDLVSGMRVRGPVHGTQGVLEKHKLTRLSFFPLQRAALKIRRAGIMNPAI